MSKKAYRGRSRLKALSRALVKKREERNHSQETAALEIGVSSQTVSRWERGESYPMSRPVVRAVLEYLEREELPK